MSENPTTVILSVDNCKGYAADQVESTMTLRDLLAAVEDAITEFGEDAIIATKDTGNRYGAQFGRLDQWGDLFTDAAPEDEDGVCPQCGYGTDCDC